MGVYAEQVLPRIVNAACGMKVTQPLRQRVCEGLGGDVVEIGFGSGHNVPYYPAAAAASRRSSRQTSGGSSHETDSPLRASWSSARDSTARSCRWPMTASMRR